MENNVWGEDKSPGPKNQCLVRSMTDKKMGWSWEYGGCDPTVFAFPEVIAGWKPWSDGQSTNMKLNYNAGKYTKLWMKYHTVTYNDKGTYNLAVNAWVTRTKRTGYSEVSNTIVSEILWFLHGQNGAKPAGHVVGHVRIDKVRWALYQDRRVDNGRVWTFYTFQPVRGSLCKRRNGALVCQGTLSIRRYMKRLIRRKFLNPKHYVQGVEMGNEVYGDCTGGSGPKVGKGTTIVKRFEVNSSVSRRKMRKRRTRNTRLRQRTVRQRPRGMLL